MFESPVIVALTSESMKKGGLALNLPNRLLLLPIRCYPFEEGFRCEVPKYDSDLGLTSEGHEEFWINRDAVGGLIIGWSSFLGFRCCFAVRAARVREDSATVVAAVSNLTDAI